MTISGLRMAPGTLCREPGCGELATREVFIAEQSMTLVLTSLYSWYVCEAHVEAAWDEAETTGEIIEAVEERVNYHPCPGGTTRTGTAARDRRGPRQQGDQR